MEKIFVIENVNFKGIISYPKIEIAKSKITFISGASGCGKTTLLRILNGTVPIDNGSVYYDGKDIDDIDTIELRRKVLLISQSVFLFDKTIEENFELFYEFREMEKPDKSKIKYFLDLALADFSLNSDCTRMSGGERQRAYIAICMSFGADVIMLDEPTAALDKTTARMLMNNIREFCVKKDVTFIVVSHDKDLADKYGDEVIKLEVPSE